MWMLSLVSLAVAVTCLVNVDGWLSEWNQEVQKDQTGRLESRDVSSTPKDFVGAYKSTAIANPKWENYLRALHTTIIWCGRLTAEGKTASFTLDLGKIRNRVHLNWNYRDFGKAMDFFNEITKRNLRGFWLKNILKKLLEIADGEQIINRNYKYAADGMKKDETTKVETVLKSAASEMETIIEIALKIQEEITAKAVILQEIAAGVPDSESAANSRSILQVLSKEMPKVVEFWTDFNQLLQTMAISSQITIHYGLEENKHCQKISSVKTSNSSTCDSNLKIIKRFVKQSFITHFFTYLFPSKLRKALDQIIRVYYSEMNIDSHTEYMKQVQLADNAVPYLMNGTKDADAKMKAIRDSLINLNIT